MIRLGHVIAGLVFLAMPWHARALEPLPEVYHGSGYISWQLPQDAPVWSMENLLERLRDPDLSNREKAMKQIGFHEDQVGPIWKMPAIIQPIHVDLKWLGRERQKEAVLSIPLDGKQSWVTVLFRQDSNDATYWRPFQFFVFDTDPVQGLQLSYPDILGDQTYFVGVRHLVKDDVYGTRSVQSYFKYDEKQLRLVYQETANYYRSGKYQGDPQRMTQELSFKGDQTIHRKVTIKTYPYMPGPEFYDYEEHNVKPRKVEHASETFVFNPLNFSFYDPEEEMRKLVLNPSPYIRREAARRLGMILKTAPPQLEHAMLKDRNPYVRVQCALSLQNIGDPGALPALKKALRNYNEPDNLEGAYQQAYDALSGTKTAAVSTTPPVHRHRHPHVHTLPMMTTTTAMPGTPPSGLGTDEPKLNEKMQ